LTADAVEELRINESGDTTTVAGGGDIRLNFNVDPSGTSTGAKYQITGVYEATNYDAYVASPTTVTLTNYIAGAVNSAGTATAETIQVLRIGYNIHCKRSCRTIEL